MTLVIGETHYEVERFYATINADEEDTSRIRSMINIKLKGDYIQEDILNNAYNNFDGTVVLTTSIQNYTFADYKLDSIDTNIDDTSISINIRFVKTLLED